MVTGGTSSCITSPDDSPVYPGVLWDSGNVTASAGDHKVDFRQLKVFSWIDPDGPGAAPYDWYNTVNLTDEPYSMSDTAPFIVTYNATSEWKVRSQIYGGNPSDPHSYSTSDNASSPVFATSSR